MLRSFSLPRGLIKHQSIHQKLSNPRVTDNSPLAVLQEVHPPDQPHHLAVLLPHHVSHPGLPVPGGDPHSGHVLHHVCGELAAHRHEVWLHHDDPIQPVYPPSHCPPGLLLQRKYQY